MGGKLPEVPRRLGAQPSLKNMKYTRVRHLKQKCFFKILPRRAPLWLSTSLEASVCLSVTLSVLRRLRLLARDAEAINAPYGQCTPMTPTRLNST